MEHKSPPWNIPERKMTDTVQEKKVRLAQACRDLADDIITGKFDFNTLGQGDCIVQNKPCCAFGHALDRAGFILRRNFTFNMDAYWSLVVNDCTEKLANAVGKLSVANDQKTRCPFIIANTLCLVAAALEYEVAQNIFTGQIEAPPLPLAGNRS